MKSQVFLVLASQLFVGTGASLLAWPRDNNVLVVPRQTDHVKHRLAGRVPEPTSPPKLAPRDFQLVKRDTGTCGYADGEKAYPMRCGSGYYCFNDPAVSMIDCCSSADVNDCTAAVTCLDSSQSSLWDGSVETYLCSESSAPSCVTRRYVSGEYSGYTWIACGVSGNDFGTAYYTPTDDVTTVTRTKDGITVVKHESTSSLSSATTATSSSLITSPAQPPPSQGSSVPIGAIVGGALGGLAVIALIAFGVFYICIQNKRGKQGPQPVVGGGQPGPIQPQPIPVQDTKVNYYQSTMASPPTSPVPPYSPPLHSGAISPVSAVTNVGYAPPPPQPQQQYFAHAELDTVRGDGQVHQLP